ncbi:MAG TPA: DUF5947 family protein [Fimbriiglobus sp.]|jgi:hypothetical protein
MIHSTKLEPAATTPFGVLKRFARRREPEEMCELCSNALDAGHPHLVEPLSQKMLCSCEACAILFSSQQNGLYRRVSRRIVQLTDFRLDDARWDELYLPINLAFFHCSTAAGRVVALYPSPAGAMHSLLSLESWQGLVDDNPILGEFEADVEALLVNRVSPRRDYYRVPIDECYKLVGLVRSHWQGLSGGSQVWGVIAEFFRDLEARAVGGSPCRT